MAEFLKDYSNLAGAGAAFQGFAEGMERAQDKKYKRLEQEAQLKALETRMQREGELNDLAAYKERLKRDPSAPGGFSERPLSVSEQIKEEREGMQHGTKFQLDANGQPIPGTSHYDPAYLEMQKQKSEADPFGLKRLGAENAAKPKEYEFASAGYAKRMEEADKNFKDVMAKGFDPSAIRNQAQGALPGFLEGLKGDDLKLYEQAKENFISAVLRKESGAAISNSERSQEAKKYFPQAGDPPEVVDQKERSREQAIANLRATAGRAYGMIPTAQARPKSMIKLGGMVNGGMIRGASPAAQKPQTVMQNGHVYTLNPQTGEYE